jgi:hypothetical protein
MATKKQRVSVIIPCLTARFYDSAHFRTRIFACRWRAEAHSQRQLGNANRRDWRRPVAFTVAGLDPEE